MQHYILGRIYSILHVVSQDATEGNTAQRKLSTKSQEHSQSSDTGHLVASRKDSNVSGTMQDIAFVIEDPSEQT